MNAVALTGRVVAAGALGLLVPPGWAVVALEVARRQPGLYDEPGTLSVALLLPPSLEPGELREGDYVAVVGGLDIDVEDPTRSPAVHPVIVAWSVERITRPGR